MSDLVVPVQNFAPGVSKRMRDMGDGTYADVMTENIAVIPVDRSGVIAQGGTSQQLCPAGPERRAFWIQNLSSYDLWVNDTGASATVGRPSLKIPVGGIYESLPNGISSTVINITGSTSGQSFAAREY